MAFTNPKENLKELGLGRSMVVADFGSGGGGYVILAAKEVQDGRVYAIDIQKGLLNKIQNDALSHGLSNIEIVWADLEKLNSTGIKENSVDVGIVSNLLFLLENQDVFAEEVKRILRPGGRVLVVDWSDSFGGLGPQPDHVFNEESARKLFEDKGFLVEKSLFNAGDHHYGFIARLKE